MRIDRDLKKLSPLSKYMESVGQKPFQRRPLHREEESDEVTASQAYAAWAGYNSFVEKQPASAPSSDKADRVDSSTSRRQPIAPSQDRADPFRRRWLDTLLDTNMDRTGVGRPVKTGPQPIKPIGRGLMDALKEALENNDGYSDPIRGPVAL